MINRSEVNRTKPARESWAAFEVWRQQVQAEAEALGVPGWATPPWRARYAVRAEFAK